MSGKFQLPKPIRYDGVEFMNVDGTLKTSTKSYVVAGAKLWCDKCIYSLYGPHKPMYTTNYMGHKIEIKQVTPDVTLSVLSRGATTGFL